MQRIVIEIDDGSSGREAARLAARFDVALCAARYRRPGADARAGSAARERFFHFGRAARHRESF